MQVPRGSCSVRRGSCGRLAAVAACHAALAGCHPASVGRRAALAGCHPAFVRSHAAVAGRHSAFVGRHAASGEWRPPSAGCRAAFAGRRIAASVLDCSGSRWRKSKRAPALDGGALAGGAGSLDWFGCPLSAWAAAKRREVDDRTDYLERRRPRQRYVPGPSGQRPRALPRAALASKLDHRGRSTSVRMHWQRDIAKSWCRRSRRRGRTVEHLSSGVWRSSLPDHGQYPYLPSGVLYFGYPTCILLASLGTT